MDGTKLPIIAPQWWGTRLRTNFSCTVMLLEDRRSTIWATLKRLPVYKLNRRFRDINFWKKVLGARELPKVDTTPENSAQAWPSSKPQAHLVAGRPEELLPSTQQSRLFFGAVRDGQLDNIKSLLKDDPSWVFRKGEQDMTGLANAALKGRKSVPELLLAHNADINSQMRGGWTPSHVAAWYGSKEVAEGLLAHHASVNVQTESGDTPWHFASTASSGLPVSFGAEFGNGSNCTVSGTTVSTSGGGVCIVFAGQVGNAQFLPAPQVTESLAD
jgi:hypothetical protein